MMVLAVTLHNIPEGMAVGVVYAGFLSGSAQSRRRARWRCPLALPFRIFPRARSSPCRCGRRGEPRAGRLGGVLSGVRRAYRRGADASRGAACDPGAAVSAELCSGRHALCGGGGADSRNVTGRALQHWHGLLCAGFSVMMVLDVALG